MNQINAEIVEGESEPIAKFGDQKIELPPLSGLRNASGTKVIVSIRPEYAQIVTHTQAGAVTGELDLVETPGFEALLHMSVEGARFVIRTPTLGNINLLNAVTGFTAPPELMRVFDAITGMALSGQMRVG